MLQHLKTSLFKCDVSLNVSLNLLIQNRNETQAQLCKSLKLTLLHNSIYTLFQFHAFIRIPPTLH